MSKRPYRVALNGYGRIGRCVFRALHERGAKAEFAESALQTTRTVWSNPLLTWVYWGNNFHTAHHLHGGAVHQNVRAITREFVAPNIDREWIESGYLAFHWRIFRGLPWLPARR